MSLDAADPCVLDRPFGAREHVAVAYLGRRPALGAGGHVHGEPPFRTWVNGGEETPTSRRDTCWDVAHNAPGAADARTVAHLGYRR